MSFYDLFSEKELSILQARAQSAATVTQDTTEHETTIDMLGVSLGNEAYMLPLRALTAAYRVDVNLTTPIVAVPCTPPFVAGIVNLRGHVVPVIDLAALFGIPNETPDSTAFVVVNNEEMTVAFRVTAIGDTTRVRAREIAPVSELFGLTKTEYLQGTLPDGTVVLDMDAILNDPILIVDDTAS